jgi:hypothetical protein
LIQLGAVRLWDTGAGKRVLVSDGGAVILGGEKHAPSVQSHGRFGVRIEAPNDLLIDQLNLPKGHGLVVTEVIDKSPAQKAGVKVNDVLIRFNNQPVPNSAEDFLKVVAAVKAEAPIEIVIVRRGRAETIRGIKLLPPPAPIATFTRTAASRVAGQVVITVNSSGKSFTLRRQEGPLSITVVAEAAHGKKTVLSIAIEDKGLSAKYEKAADVPAAYRSKVDHLIQLLDFVDAGAWRRLTPSGAASDLIFRVQEADVRLLPLVGPAQVELVQQVQPLNVDVLVPKVDIEIVAPQTAVPEVIRVNPPANVDLNIVIPKTPPQSK